MFVIQPKTTSVTWKVDGKKFNILRLRNTYRPTCLYNNHDSRKTVKINGIGKHQISLKTIPLIKSVRSERKVRYEANWEGCL